ncbi:FAD/NAD(P)-binding domain-containing protein [Linnemannia elongata AG-77]|uniref:FAD/NAD(P)-binding domain-containing protein n=1 Tax=Linnemannia elongata AG-77 TaxID=1314771 RepID=A0A197K028_9FUNG|nr:FAD/NAD(P)-binding domain-containing protein [Linnemannia elongata AG-77]
MEINPAVTFKHDRSLIYNKRPKVLIVGAGLAGLTLGMLLHKANIPFEIYERAAEVKPLGSAMAFSATTANLFKQCGIYDEFVSISKLSSVLNVCNEQRESEYKIDFRGHDEMFGAKGYIVTRPKLYDLLLRQVPQERIHLGKKILSMENGGNGVLIRCSDGSVAEGDILVGADGAYSAVRQNLYAKLLKDKRLPPSDALPLPFSTVCLVGQTRPLTPEEFPDVALEECQFRNVVGNNRPYAWSTFTTKQGTVCWICIQYLDDESSKENDAFRNSEWGPEAAAAMAAQVRDFPVVSGGDKKLTLGDLIDWTPKELMSKAMQEEKVFKTWFDCRTVLIGDACHKFNPAGGMGATNAMHDALVLANLINGLPFHPVANEIEAAFKAYREERCHWVKDAYEASKIFKAMAGQKMMAKVVRFCVKNTPQWVFQQGQNRTTCNRPQCAFLPLVQDNGRVRPAPQPSLSVKTPKDPENNEDKVEAIPAAAAAI